ncbi:MAG: HAD superfamily hydrolase (TIGR01490 family) [Pseudohongiellaceae bacterium]|jgi:HAD superfamily hydrolase (TIGR01490 family)
MIYINSLIKYELIELVAGNKISDLQSRQGYNQHFISRQFFLMRLALFDLDNTLLAGDSDHAWGEYLIKRGLVDAQHHAEANDRFYADYQTGTLDIHAYVRFTLSPIMSKTLAELALMHKEFMAEFIEPMVLPKAKALVEQHKAAGDRTVIITATNTFITQAIAENFGVDTLLGTDLVVQAEHFTGEISGTPCFQEGKVKKLRSWLDNETTLSAAASGLRIEDGIFYTDSINDLPLLEQVAEPIVVDGDSKLTQVAAQRRWRQISLRN